jgi:hypothetical protein
MNDTIFQILLDSTIDFDLFFFIQQEQSQQQWLVVFLKDLKINNKKKKNRKIVSWRRSGLISTK